MELSGTSVEIEISKVNGEPIEKAMVRPVANASTAEIINGKAYVVIDEPTNISVDIDGQMEDHSVMGYDDSPPKHNMFVFVNPVFQVPDMNISNVATVAPGEAIPDRATWDTLVFLPGEHTIETPHMLKSNETYYIPGDAVVYGTLKAERNSKNIAVYGSGALSGENIVRKLVGEQESKPITGREESSHFEGFVIPDTPHHTVIFACSSQDREKTNLFNRIKILGWRLNGDGFHLLNNGDVTNCFIRTADDGCYYGGNVRYSNNVFWTDINGATVRVVKGGANSYFKDNTVIYKRVNWIYRKGARVVTFYQAGEKFNIQDVLIKNLLVEDPYPSLPPFWLYMVEDLRMTQEMKNITIENVYQKHPGISGPYDDDRGKPQNSILGLDEDHKFSNITFKHCYYDGKWLRSLEDGDFLVNEFIENIAFIHPSPMEKWSRSKRFQWMPQTDQ